MTVKLGDSEYAYLSAFLKGKCGLDYPPSKRHELDKAWARVADGLDPKRFCALIGTPQGKGLLQDFLNALTVGETYFFRVQPHFDAVRNLILPDVISRAAREKTIRVLSAGCATGEEPYSLAMVITDFLGGKAGWSVDVLAVDINTRFLETAVAGRYGEWSFRKVDDYWRAKYFRREGTLWRVDPEITKLVRFAHANLLDEDALAGVLGPYSFDLIVCRNVTIYFDLEANRKLLGSLARRLTAGGWYLPGHADPINDLPDWELVQYPGAVLYRRRKPGDAPRHEKKPARAAKGATALPLPAAPDLEGEIAADDAVETILAKVDAYVAAGRDEAARELCESLAARSEEAGVYWRLGRVLGNLGRYDEAGEWFEKAIAADPHNALPYYYAALVLEELGDNEGAFEYLRRSLFLDHSFPLAHFAMGNFYRWRRDDVRARRSYRNVLALLTDKPDDELISADGLTAGQLRNVVKQIL